MSFAKRIDLRAAQIQGNLLSVMREATLSIQHELVIQTPVDTGKARSNWRVSVRSPKLDTIPPYAPGSRLGRGETANAQAAINQGKSALGVIKVSGGSGGFTIPPLFITNSVHYIGLLNDGWSSQAPASFVQMGILAGASRVRNARLLTTRIR